MKGFHVEENEQVIRFGRISLVGNSNAAGVAMKPEKTIGFRPRRMEQGASAMEFAFLAALIAAVIVVVVTTLGVQTQAMFCTFVSNFGGSC
ncbi:MAG: hypothetical protein H6R01_1604 [Burkholderiaceae bacterium]|nr:hypothetical protein [Burkholderiaceae bacterium]